MNDIAVDEKNPSTSMSVRRRRLWKTTNNGTNLYADLDEYRISSIGDLALAPSNPDISTVGTANRHSPELDRGVPGYTSPPTAARVRIHRPERNPDHRARDRPPEGSEYRLRRGPGSNLGPNKERGLYKTTDGGKTWTNTKFIDEHTGSPMVMHPTNPNVLGRPRISVCGRLGLQRWGPGECDLDGRTTAP